ncbi:chemotaxis protein CheA [Vibrio sp. ZSDZ65]|uniref:Chemotaxis protein CheA n=1 Tax=Vibrio qingdaonensis TaxID=2829491 RepID=A0A9X3CPG5_9VIBR|nr:chemotaxis protein CheA [Vibrio qingdaonensis]MCW8347142.1 chemotaxis protein CheA [Vibrio qingdaonensis]
MSGSAQQFEKIFFEEMTEHLEEMESLLLEMNESGNESVSSEVLDAIFRAVHSIKGGAGIFGFDDISHVTHILENLLDQLRTGQISLQRTMVDVFLQARDVLESLKAAHQFDDEEEVSNEHIKQVCEALNHFSSLPSSPTSKEDCSAKPPIAADPAYTPPSSNLHDLSDSEKSALKILLVEDSKVIQKVASFTLSKLGYSFVDIAENGQQALDSLNAALNEPYQFILLDCQMPIMDGYQATRAIREGLAGDVHQGITIIAMTAMVGEEEKQKCLQTGMNDYLVKPIKANLVDDIIKRWHHRAQDSIPSHQPVPKEPNNAAQRKRSSNPRLRSKQHEASSIRVSTQKVDQLINQVGELIITQSMLQKLTFDLGLDANELLAARLNQLESNTRDLQASVMSVRMMPIGTVFGRFPRIVRDLSNSLNKDIRLIIEGEQTQLDKGLLEKLVDPLTHLIRNSIDHGIESPEERTKANKPVQGTIKLSAVYRGGDVIVHVEDDGLGIDPKKIVEKAQKNGMHLPQNMNVQDIFQLIFSAGFSTAEQVTTVSGRGVGMDVVKRNISSMGGTVEISSTLGVGTKMSIQLPLTLAILEGMSICVGEHVYIIPLTYIVESIQPNIDDLKKLNSGETMIRVHDEYVPILRLHKFFNLDTDVTELHEGIVVLLEHGNKIIALFVDSLIGQQQVVLKNLENNFRKIPCISGATIMGDGRVSLILDVADLVRQR